MVFFVDSCPKVDGPLKKDSLESNWTVISHESWASKWTILDKIGRSVEPKLPLMGQGGRLFCYLHEWIVQLWFWDRRLSRTAHFKLFAPSSLIPVDRPFKIFNDSVQFHRSLKCGILHTLTRLMAITQLVTRWEFHICLLRFIKL